MILSLTKPVFPGLIFPHVEYGRTYYVLFHTDKAKGPLYVKTSDLENPSLFYLGDICSESYEGPVVGSCFFTQANHVIRGGIFCLAYTGILGKRADAKAIQGIDFGVDLSLKTSHFLMWNKRGTATLIVTPSMSDSLRESLES